MGYDPLYQALHYQFSTIWGIFNKKIINPLALVGYEMIIVHSYPTRARGIIALLFIQNIFYAQTCKLYSRPFLSLLNDTALCPGFLGQWFNNLWRQWFNNLQRAALLTSFWSQSFNNLQRSALLTSLVQYDRILGRQQLFMVNYACGFNQPETGKYFEWIINLVTPAS